MQRYKKHRMCQPGIPFGDRPAICRAVSAIDPPSVGRPMTWGKAVCSGGGALFLTEGRNSEWMYFEIYSLRFGKKDNWIYYMLAFSCMTCAGSVKFSWSYLLLLWQACDVLQMMWCNNKKSLISNGITCALSHETNINLLLFSIIGCWHLNKTKCIFYKMPHLDENYGYSNSCYTHNFRPAYDFPQAKGRPTDGRSTPHGRWQDDRRVIQSTETSTTPETPPTNHSHPPPPGSSNHHKYR